MSAGAKTRRPSKPPASRTARAAGLVLHPTSLAGPFGIGDLGDNAIAMLDWMREAGLSVWQHLPLGPTGLGDSPYNTLSAFAGNPLLISPERLSKDGLLVEADLASARVDEAARVDFAAVRRARGQLLRAAFVRLNSAPTNPLHEELREFASAERRRLWLDDWALFATLREKYAERSWVDWPVALRDRDRRALDEARRELASSIRFHEFTQFLFDRQWRYVRDAARARGIRILGDVPIYVALDSADVWSQRELFELGDDGRPIAVAGVPPDYFSADGQLWGNPLYRWQRLAEDDFRWWTARLAHELARADLLRLDHFRAFVSFWRIPADALTARGGRWTKGPGEALFRKLRQRLGALPFLVEDLGEIDESVHRLRRKLALPGMRVLQFAFGVEDSLHAPHRHERDLAVYTGTHDNDTSRSWFALAGEEERQRALTYLGGDGAQISWSMVRAALTSPAMLAILPLQDLLDLDGSARMNVPSRPSGNWTWRLQPSDVPAELPRRLRELVRASARLPPEAEKAVPTPTPAASSPAPSTAPADGRVQ